jgi:hypothetical protein
MDAVRNQDFCGACTGNAVDPVVFVLGRVQINFDATDDE